MNFYTDNPSLSLHLHHPDMVRVAETAEKGFAEKGAALPADSEEAIGQYEMILNLLGEISAEVIAQNAADVDLEGPQLADGRIQYAAGTQKNLSALVSSGLYGMTLERRFGGLNMPRVVAVMAAEIIARADVGFATIWGLQDCADTIQQFASEELKQRFLPRIQNGATCSMDLTEPDAGSDLQSVRLRATFDEANGCWRLNGVKRFITNGDADIHLVLARSEEGTSDGRGLSYFVFDRADGGMTVRRIENKMGIKGSPTAELVFDNAPAQLVGERRMGLIKYVMSLMNGARLGVGAQSVGLCEAACREADIYAATREQFGRPIADFIQVQEILRAMHARTLAARTLMYETARYVDLSATSRQASRIADMLTPLVKLMASEYANRCAYDCIQVHGGSGFMKEYACERLYRDARILTIYEGTSQLQVVAALKGIVSGGYLKIVADYDAQAASLALSSEQNECLAMLREGADHYKAMYDNAATEGTSTPRFERQARKLTEQAALLIMGYLLLFDSIRDSNHTDACHYIAEQL